MMAKSGGFGLADLIAKGLERSQTPGLTLQFHPWAAYASTGSDGMG